jgi:hypothetical protein
MVERVTNGDFADGLDGWNPQCNCPAGYWYIYVEYEGGDPQPVYCTIETLADACTASIEQSIDLTGVEKITFDVCPGINDWLEPLGWGKLWIDDVKAVEWNTYGYDWIHNEIGVSSWTGVHLIKFEVFGGGFDSGLEIANVSAIGSDLPPAPVAAFHATPLSGVAPLQVQFTDDSTNTPTSWIWDFGAGILSDLQNPLVTYLGAGTYTVKLIATNAAGSDQETKTDYITVAPPIPRYKPSWSLNICTPE